MIAKESYRIADLEMLPTSPEVLISGEMDAEVMSRIGAVIETEGPITRELLLKRVVNSFDLYKVGSRLEKYFSAILESFTSAASDEYGVVVYHAKDEVPDILRKDSREIRFSYQIPPCEAANAIVLSLEKATKRLRRSELYRAFIEELGYTKSGSELEILFKKSLQYALDRGRVKRSSSSTYHLP